MSYTVSITSQGQINIPAKIRRQLNLDKTKQAILSVEAGKVIIEPIKDLLELGGSLKTTKKPLSNKDLHEFVAETISRENKQKWEK